MLIDSVSTRVSLIDGKPIGYSPAHLLIRDLLGCAAAGLTYEEEIRLHPPDEVIPSGFSGAIGMVMGKERRYQLRGRHMVPGQTEHSHPIQTPEAG